MSLPPVVSPHLVLALQNSVSRTMEGRNGDAPETGESGSSSTSSTETTALKAWLPENWVPDEWPSGRRLSHWRERTPRTGRKTAPVLALVALLAAIGIGGYYWYQGVQEQRRQERLQKIAEKVSDPVYWPSNRVTTLDAKFQLSTKWLPDQTTNGSASYKNGELKYKLNIRGYPKALEEAWRSEFNSSYFITIHLLDKDDFEITSLEITLDQLTRTVNPKGDGIGFSMQGAEKMSLRTYRRIDDWKISWNL